MGSPAGTASNVRGMARVGIGRPGALQRCRTVDALALGAMGHAYTRSASVPTCTRLLILCTLPTGCAAGHRFEDLSLFDGLRR